MGFLQNFSVRLKLFSSLLIVMIIFLILLFWQFSALNKIDKHKEIIQKINQAQVNIDELIETNNHDLRLLLELIQSNELVISETIIDKHIVASKKIEILYDSLYNKTNVIYTDKRDLTRIKLINYLDETNSTIQNILNPYFKNVEKIKKEEIEFGNKIDFNQIKYAKITDSNSNDSIQEDNDDPIIVVESEDLTASTRKIQLIKIYNFCKQNYIQINKQYDEINNIYSQLFYTSGAKIENRTKQIKIFNSLFALLAFITVLIVMIIVSYTFTNPLLKIVTIVNRLSKGELPPKMEYSSKDELGKMTLALNKLISGLKQTSAFATNIGKGDFKSNYSPLSNKDVLGNALLEMRTSLQAANEEEEKRKIEDRQRNWTTEGLAKFGEILRHNTENITLLSKEIVENLVNYLKANQAGIFILNDTNKDDVFLELISAYAYSREKFLEKKIRLGVGLVGSVAIEKFTMYITDIPDEYIEIESGLGGANPKSLLIVPLKLDDEILGVVEIASFNTFEKYEIELVELIAESIASTLSTSNINTKTAELLEQSRIQTQEMQEQEEEMRQNMEEIVSSQEDALSREKELKIKVDELENMKVNLVNRDKKQRARIEKTTSDVEKQIKNLKNLEQHIEKVFDNSLNVIITFDESKKVQFFNKEATKILGYEKSDVIGLNIFEFMPKKVAKEFDKKISKYFKTKHFDIIKGTQKMTVKKRDGQEIEVLFNLQEIELYGLKKLIANIKTLEKVNNLTQELEELKEYILFKEFNYSTQLNVLENFVKQKGLKIPDNLAKESNLINWNDNYSIGLHIIDQQHKKWIDFINNLYKAYKNNISKEELNEEIFKLLDYTDYHFGFEEKYLEDFNCENEEEHKKSHENFVIKIKKFHNQFTEGNEDAVYKLIVYVNNWVLNHIQHEDLNYVGCFKKNGLV